MSLISSVTRKPGGRSSRIDALWQRTYTSQFTVETTSTLVGPLAVRSAAGIPQPGQSYSNGLAVGDPRYEFDLGAFVQSVQAQEDPDGGGVQWTVTVEYGPYDTNALGSDPVAWPIRVTVAGDTFERVVYFDVSGNPIRNSAGDPFGDPITIEDARVTLQIMRNELEATFDLAVPQTFNNTVNSVAWNGFAPGLCKMGVITKGPPQYDPTAQVYFAEVTYPVSLNRDGWVKELLDQGYNELDGDGKPKPIMNQGQQISEPVPLDGSGHRLDASGAPVTLTKDVYDSADWTSLGIDLALRLGGPGP